MTALSREQLAGYARAAGFTGHDVDIAVAVALAESGGNPRAHNSTPPDDSYGPWQINMYGALGPDRRKRFGLTSNADLYDPAVNARVAYALWKDRGWSHWTTYTSGKYKKYLADSVVSATDSGGTSINPITGISDSINKFGENFLKGFASVGAVLVAVVLFILGVVILMRNKVTAVIPGGNIAKVAKVAKGVSS